MKKYALLAILVLFAMAVWNMSFDMDGMHVVFGDEELDGPLGALVGVVAGGLGLLIGGLVMLFVGVVLALVFAGLGVMAIVGLGFGALVLALAVSPLMLPVLIPVAIIWLLARRRKQRSAQAMAEQPYPAA